MDLVRSYMIRCQVRGSRFRRTCTPSRRCRAKRGRPSPVPIARTFLRESWWASIVQIAVAVTLEKPLGEVVATYCNGGFAFRIEKFQWRVVDVAVQIQATSKSDRIHTQPAPQVRVVSAIPCQTQSCRPVVVMPREREIAHHRASHRDLSPRIVRETRPHGGAVAGNHLPDASKGGHGYRSSRMSRSPRIRFRSSSARRSSRSASGRYANRTR